MENEVQLGAAMPAPADAVPGIPAGYTLRCAVCVSVDRFRTVRFNGYIYVGYAISGRGRPLVFGQCQDTLLRILGNRVEVKGLVGLWSRCHRQKLTSLSAADRRAVFAILNPSATPREAA